MSNNNFELEYFRKVFVGSLNYNTTEESLRSHFEKYGQLVDCVVMKESKTGKSRGFGFVTYSNSYMVDEMMKNRPHRLDGRELETKRACPREESSKPGAESTTCKLFIGAIREGLNEDHLKEYFSKYGRIEDCVVMKDKETNKTRGFGFVTFDDYDPVDKIVLEKTHVINGQSLAVKKALPKEQTVSGQQKFNKANFNDNNNNNNVSPRRGNNRFNNANNNFNENYYNNNNDYSDEFNFNHNGFNNFSNNMPAYQNQQRMPSNDMQNNFNNFALLAQKMLQASFGSDPNMMNRGDQASMRRGFESGPIRTGSGPVRNDFNNRQRQTPYSTNMRKTK